MGADIYSVGATLFYLLTGRPPFEADRPVELIARVMSEPAPSVRKLQRKVPRALARTVARCLAKDPQARFPDHTALRHALTPHGSEFLNLASMRLRFVAAGQDYGLIALVFVISMLALGVDSAPGRR